MSRLVMRFYWMYKLSVFHRSDYNLICLFHTRSDLQCDLFISYTLIYVSIYLYSTYLCTLKINIETHLSPPTLLEGLLVARVS